MDEKNKNVLTDTAPATEIESPFIERMKALFESTRSKSDELKRLYTTDQEVFKDTLDNFADDVAAQDEEYQTTLSHLKEVRRMGGNDAEIVQKLRKIHNQIKEIIVSEAGLPDEARFSEIEQAKQSIVSLLQEANHGQPVIDPKEALKTLDIIKGSDDSDEVYRFPYELMPPSVVEKWQTYLASVCHHMQVAESISDASGQEAVMQADRARTYAHNSVTDDVHVILGLQDIGGWNRAKTRELLGKIRDFELPSSASALSPEAHKLVDTKTHEIAISTLLSSRLNAHGRSHV